MSKLAEYKALEAKLAEQLAQLDALKNDEELKREIDFEQKLRSLLADYGFSLRQVIAILDPKATRTGTPVQPSGRKARTVKRYKNPHTDEVVETKGGNHRVLKEWKAEYGSDTVESWLQ
ncbi:histone-like nucleoid-structuring protein, MvaT/MvaU family [Pseudomonas sp. CR3202]|uniref:histone-like nucleoid-structuring protein, MvaT/MvaU family n=1 Tax=Pseudomonas sp. CR3202 TaxID=3351532 RepID=UPI003BF01FB3